MARARIETQKNIVFMNKNRPNPKVLDTEPPGQEECVDLVFLLWRRSLKEKKDSERLTRPEHHQRWAGEFNLEPASPNTASPQPCMETPAKVAPCVSRSLLS